MTANWPVRLVGAVLILGSLAIGIMRVMIGTSGSPLDYELQTPLFTGVAVVYTAVAVLIIERARGNVVGPLVLGLGFLMAFYLIADSIITQHPQPAFGPYLATVLSIVDAPLFLMVAVIFLVFPDGRLPSERWRLLARVGVVSAAAWVAVTAVTPGPFAFYRSYENPFGISGFPGHSIATPLYLVEILLVVLSVVSLVGRWRRGGPVERAQLKWVALAAAFIGFVMASYAVLFGPGQFNRVADAAVGIAIGFFPIAIGIAILRYRLFEIDRLVSRAIAYVVITGALVASYAGLILILQGPLGSVTGGETIPVAISTLIVAALFQPVRHRVQSLVDRRFDRARFDAERTSAAFNERLRDDVEIDSVSADLRTTVSGALRPARLGLWLRKGTGR